MPHRDDVLRFMNETLEIDRFTDGLPIGLQVEGREEVRRVGLGVSACVEVFEAAAAWNADMVVVHHGMFWDKESRIVRGPLKRRLQVLLENDMTLAGYHLPLDAHPEIGNNAAIVRALGARNLAPFGEYRGNVISFRGEVEPVPAAEIERRAAAHFGTEPTSLLFGPELVRTVACISGGGWDMLEDAARQGVDCFVTGTFDEPAYHLAREWGVHFMAFGHHATEKDGVQALGTLLAGQFGLETRFFDVANPL